MQVYIGNGEIARIPEILLQAKPTKGKVLVLTDFGVSATGVPKRISELVSSQGFSVDLIDTVPREPYSGEVDLLASEARNKGFEYIIGIGGGSVLDTAKLLSILLVKQSETVESLLEKGIPGGGLPTIMVPTTAGTGSEATPIAIVALKEKKLKVGIVSAFIVPKSVILDPSCTVGLPQEWTACTGVDALCHLLECYISKRANPYSDLLALEGMRLIFSSLQRAFENGADLDARADMLLAAFYGGRCIASSSTTAVHALSYPLGGMYRIPHGVANAMLLTPVMEFNRDAVVEKLKQAVSRIGMSPILRESDPSVDFVYSIRKLVEYLKIPTSLRDFGISKKDIPSLTDRALQVTRLLSNNPKPMSREDVEAIYERVL